MDALRISTRGGVIQTMVENDVPCQARLQWRSPKRQSEMQGRSKGNSAIHGAERTFLLRFECMNANRKMKLLSSVALSQSGAHRSCGMIAKKGRGHLDAKYISEDTRKRKLKSVDMPDFGTTHEPSIVLFFFLSELHCTYQGSYPCRYQITVFAVRCQQFSFF